mgnify:CR=1 FL=1
MEPYRLKPSFNFLVLYIFKGNPKFGKLFSDALIYCNHFI